MTEIHEMALSDDHLAAVWSSDRLKMANAVIENMQKKLLRIADLIQVVCGD